jgi:nitrogen fixation protein NifB
MTAALENSRIKHPCFNSSVKGLYGRVHLPVAPACNISCNFCDRRYDCVNESRPGVTSVVMSPHQAVDYVNQVRSRHSNITVAGIAGPGDPFANPDKTMSTLRLLHRAHPDLLLCISSNGLAIGPYIDELAELNVSHLTITVCAVDPAIGARIYSRVQDGDTILTGESGAALLLSRQLEAITAIKKHGMTIKVNCILIPGINDHHVERVAQRMQSLGVDLFNCMPLYPAKNSVFGSLPQPDKKSVERVRQKAESYLPQMRHCRRCRADAVGLLGESHTAASLGCMAEDRLSEQHSGGAAERPYVAVASEEGFLINQHLGEAASLSIWERRNGDYVEVEKRAAPQPGSGARRWREMAEVLADCRAVLVSGVGEKPAKILATAGIETIEAEGLIAEGLAAVYQGKRGTITRRRKRTCSRGECSGDGLGCG